MRFKYVGTVAMLICIFVNAFDCLHCYQCRSDLHEGCETITNDTHLMPCKGGASEENLACRKMTQYLYFMSKYQQTVVRECAFENWGEDCYKSVWIDAKIYSCDCLDDGCNRASIRRTKVDFLVLLFILILFPP